jgi:hypothetical protein
VSVGHRGDEGADPSAPILVSTPVSAPNSIPAIALGALAVAVVGEQCRHYGAGSFVCVAAATQPAQDERSQR